MNDLQTYFTKVADQWDEIRNGYFTEHMRDFAIAKAKLPKGAVVADIGTGTGFVAAGLAPHAAKVYGFDASEEMLKVAKKNSCIISEHRAAHCHRRSNSTTRQFPRRRFCQHVFASRARTDKSDSRNGAHPKTGRRIMHHRP